MATNNPPTLDRGTIKAIFRMAGIELSDAQMPLVEQEIANMTRLIAALDGFDVNNVEQVVTQWHLRRPSMLG